MPWELGKFLDPGLLREGLKMLEIEKSLRQTAQGVSNGHLRVSFLEMEWYMRNQLLRDADWAGMHHSVELRVPFLDKNLFKSILPVLTQNAPLDKNDLANTPAKALPLQVQNRRKTGFITPVDLWARKMMGGKTLKPDRGLRNWAKRVYDKF